MKLRHYKDAHEENEEPIRNWKPGKINIYKEYVEKKYTGKYEWNAEHTVSAAAERGHRAAPWQHDLQLMYAEANEGSSDESQTGTIKYQKTTAQVRALPRWLGA